MSRHGLKHVPVDRLGETGHVGNNDLPVCSRLKCEHVYWPLVRNSTEESIQFGGCSEEMGVTKCIILPVAIVTCHLSISVSIMTYDIYT